MSPVERPRRRWTKDDLRPFELLSSPVWVFDIVAETMWWANAAAVRLWDAEDLEALLARDFSSDMSDATRVRLREYLVRFEVGETLQESWVFYPKGMAAVSVSCVLSGIEIDVGGPRLAMLSEGRRPETGIPAHELRAVEALRHTGVAVSLFDAEGRALFENPASSRSWGHGAASPSLWSRFADPEQAACIRTALEQGRAYSGETILHTVTGPRWHGVDVSPTRDPVAATSAILVNARDISEERDAKAALIEATRTADAANRAKSAFLANMSHEIRTPMNGVLGMSALLLETELGDEQRGYVEAVHMSASGLLGIINDILDLSRIDARKLTFEEVDFDLRATVEEALEVHGSLAADKGLELTSLVDRSIPVTLRGDPGRLRQVLINLLGNAVKFTPSGEVKVTVSLVEQDHRRLRLRFEIRDTGIGVSPDARARVFDPFVQADESTTREYGGTGLGLAIAKQLVSMMGGDIGVEDAEGAGSAFWFTARLAKSERAEPPAPEPALAGVEVLVVEDHESSAAALVQQLAELGIDAATCSRASALEWQSARAMAGAGRVVFVDQGPRGEGLALLRTMRETPALGGTRAILVSRVGARTQGSSPSAEVDGYLLKPVRRESLRSVLAAVLHERGPRAGRSEGDATLGPTVPEATPQAQAQAQVLIVEDNRINQVVICKMLERLGIRTDVVSNGADAVEAIDTRSYAMVLMDCQMPVLDGYEATRRVRALAEPQCRTPIVAMTASAMAGDRELCLEAGMDDYVAKPIAMAQVRRLLGTFLGGS